ncbi:hypothetical protein HHI36_016283 [Cryptolaemus montrouzieri]|uniref:Uncharacterized protein n=1 Tax=Cryptolaemus montrouzieri TaxID=559131 RepID=A0ABD2NK59_9CUCU
MKDIRKKRNLWDIFKRSKILGDYQAYQRQNNSLKCQLIQSKTEYEENLLNQSAKQFFKNVKRSLNSTFSTLALTNPVNLETATDPQKVACIFADEFKKMFTDEGGGHYQHWLTTLDQNMKLRPSYYP